MTKTIKTSPVKKAVAKKAVKKAAPAKKAVSKKNISDKDLLQKEANKLINSSPKKKGSKRPVKITTSDEAGNLLDCIVDGMQDRKAKNITIINLSKLENRVCDYFVICDADSNTHVEAIASSVEEMVKKKTNEKPYHSEGHGNAEWILIDYINIVVHVFQREIREFYNLESLWADAEIKTIKD